MPEQQHFQGPLLQVAAFCENVLVEQNGGLSLIRIFDRFTVLGPHAEMKAANVSYFLVISLKSGFFRGKASVTLSPRSPSGKELTALSFPVLFEGDAERGVMIQARITMQFNEEGVFWFAVSVANVPITEIPLRIVYQQQLGNQIALP